MIQIISSNFDKTLSSSRMKTSFLLSPKESYRLQVNYIQASFRSNLWLYKLNVTVQQLDQTPAKHTGTYYACPRIAGQRTGLAVVRAWQRLGCRKLAYLFLLSQFTAAPELKQIIYSKGPVLQQALCCLPGYLQLRILESKLKFLQ